MIFAFVLHLPKCKVFLIFFILTTILTASASCFFLISFNLPTSAHKSIMKLSAVCPCESAYECVLTDLKAFSDASLSLSLTENTGARVRTVSGMSEKGVSHGVSHSRQAKLP